MEEGINDLSAALVSIEVENFKSYKGKVLFHPLKQFTAIVGPNGSGKSNFMDAVCFVMGEKSKSMRAKRVCDLIHGADRNKPASDKASVTATFLIQGGVEKNFQRIINKDASEYKINDETVSNSVYLDELNKIGINIKAKNFIVYQGTIESYATKKPKDFTAIFEEISGSGALKNDYDQFKISKDQLQEEELSFQKKKNFIEKQNKMGQQEKAQIGKYKALKKQLTDKQIELQIFSLYHNEKSTQKLENDLIAFQTEARIAGIEKEKGEENLKTMKKELGVLNRQMQKIEQDIRESEVEIKRKGATFIKAKELVGHSTKKLENSRKTLEQARKADETLNDTIKKLEHDRDMIAALMENMEDPRNVASDITLGKAQVEEYNRLKKEAQKRSVSFLNRLNAANRAQKSDQDLLDNELRKKSEKENQHKQKLLNKSDALRKIGKLSEHIADLEKVLQQERQVTDEKTQDLDGQNLQAQELQAELENIATELGDAKTDQNDVSRQKNKKAVVDKLRNAFPDVYDRLINLCQPKHPRYNVAVTKILGNKMEAIVVDTEETARKCIAFLKERRLEVETFLPLDYLMVKPLKERLRNIRDPMNVCLLFDVLMFEPHFERAVLFVTNNALVCETPEDAMKVAYDLDGQNQYDAVSLDGTFFRKNGVISGGSLDLMRKARKWNDKHIMELKLKKEKITEQLREVMRKLCKESEIESMQIRIKALEQRLRFSVIDFNATTAQLSSFETEISELTQQISEISPKIIEIELAMSERGREIQEIEASMNNIDDEVFAEFCTKIGVDNIRVYEERELHKQKGLIKRKREYEDQIIQINNNIEFEKTKGTTEKVQHWLQIVRDDEEELKTSKKAELKQIGELDGLKKKLEGLKQEKLSLQVDLKSMELKIKNAVKEARVMSENAASAQKKVTSVETEIDNKKINRHDILMQCKLDAINIPLISGQIEDVSELDLSNSDNNTSRTSSSVNTSVILERESRIVIDYSNLSRNLQNRSDVQSVITQIKEDIKSLKESMNHIAAPNFKVPEQLEDFRARLQMTNEELLGIHKNAKKAKRSFEKIKAKRNDAFMNCFTHVSSRIDAIYKKLTKDPNAQAFLSLENPEEPYLAGIAFNCIAPGKRFQQMTNLSGGEKSIAALALLFAIHSYKPAPFFILDEVDAALDNNNINKAVDYIVDSKSSLQIIVISLKREFFSRADCLIGVVPEPTNSLESNILVLDMSLYSNNLAY